MGIVIVLVVYLYQFNSEKCRNDFKIKSVGNSRNVELGGVDHEMLKLLFDPGMFRNYMMVMR